jgi:hypothetical protein
MKDVTDPKTILEHQGDRVLVFKNNGVDLAMVHVLTMVNVVELDRRVLHLTNRESKSSKPDWVLTQALFDHFRPAGENKEQAKWAVTVKGRQ